MHGAPVVQQAFISDRRRSRATVPGSSPAIGGKVTHSFAYIRRYVLQEARAGLFGSNCQAPYTTVSLYGNAGYEWPSAIHRPRR